MNTLYVNQYNDEIISMYFKYYDRDLIVKIQKPKCISWNVEKRRWEAPYSPDALDTIKKMFQDEIHIDTTSLEKYQNKRKKAKAKIEYNKFLEKFHELKKELIIQKYRRNTIKSYLKSNVELIRYSKKEPTDITGEDIKSYLYYLSNEKNYKSTTLDVVINGLKFYYSQILKKKFIYEVERPRKNKYLPTVLNKSEIKAIVKAINNLKHKTMILLIYSGGLRVSEASTMRVQDIDFERETVTIKNSKNRKGRVTLLAATLAKTLKKYLELYEPKYWLFEGQNRNAHISIRSIQKVFELAKKKAGIIKETGIHGLRHSFATNLLEEGTDIRYIQDLLGHASPKTTMIYTHVCTKKLTNIKSPLDNIDFDD